MILSCIHDAEDLKSRLPEAVFTVEGLSSPRVRCLLSNLCRTFVVHGYLEIGVFNGSTLIAAAYGNPKKRFVGVDDWSTTHSPLEARKNLEVFAPHAQLIEEDFRTLTLDGLFDVAFYDGSKDERILRGNLWKLIPMVRRGILVVDDVTELGRWCETERILFEEVARQGLRFDLYCKLSAQFTGDVDNWWNGIAVMTFL